MSITIPASELHLTATHPDLAWGLAIGNADERTRDGMRAVIAALRDAGRLS